MEIDSGLELVVLARPMRKEPEHRQRQDQRGNDEQEQKRPIFTPEPDQAGLDDNHAQDHYQGEAHQDRHGQVDDQHGRQRSSQPLPPHGFHQGEDHTERYGDHQQGAQLELIVSTFRPDKTVPSCRLAVLSLVDGLQEQQKNRRSKRPDHHAQTCQHSYPGTKSSKASTASLDQNVSRNTGQQFSQAAGEHVSRQSMNRVEPAKMLCVGQQQHRPDQPVKPQADPKRLSAESRPVQLQQFSQG
jgi:hypothetical protein